MHYFFYSYVDENSDVQIMHVKTLIIPECFYFIEEVSDMCLDK